MQEDRLTGSEASAVLSRYDDSGLAVKVTGVFAWVPEGGQCCIAPVLESDAVAISLCWNMSCSVFVPLVLVCLGRRVRLLATMLSVVHCSGSGMPDGVEFH